MPKEKKREVSGPTERESDGLTMIRKMRRLSDEIIKDIARFSII